MNRLNGLNNTAAVNMSPANGSVAGPSTATTTAGGKDNGMGGQSDDEFVEKFYVVVNEVQTDIKAMNAKANEFQMKHAEYIRCTDLEMTKSISTDKEQIMAEFNRSATSVKDKLKGIQDSIARLKAGGEEQNASILRIQNTHYQHLVRGFQTAMNDYQQIQAKCDSELRDQTKRHIKMSATNADGSCSISDEEAEQMAKQALATGQTNALFSQSQNVLDQIMEQREDILKIERQMRQLNQLFNDLAALVTQQTEVLDQVVANLGTAVDYMERGNEKMDRANELQKKTKSKMCYLIIFVVVILLFILAPTLGATIPK